jgi:hypothetical protein
MSDISVIDLGFMFVERINRADVKGLLDIMTDDHELWIFGEFDGRGKEQMEKAWRGYFDLCPEYMIHICEIYEKDNTAIIVGRTTGSHLNLPRRKEFLDEPVIWTAKVRDGLVSEWALHLCNDETREKLGIPKQA